MNIDLSSRDVARIVNALSNRALTIRNPAIAEPFLELSRRLVRAAVAHIDVVQGPVVFAGEERFSVALVGHDGGHIAVQAGMVSDLGSRREALCRANDAATRYGLDPALIRERCADQPMLGGAE